MLQVGNTMTRLNFVQTIPACKFKAKCLAIMDQVNQQHKSVIITKHGKPVAKLVPYDEPLKSLFGALKGSVRIKGDIVGSSDDVWEADSY